MRARTLSALLVASLALPVLGACVDETAYSPALPVDLYVDHFGITHTFAKTDADAMFGAGYGVARDRLFQLELIRRRAHGRLSELLGEARYNDDRIARLFDFPGLGRADYELMRAERPEDEVLFRAFVAGINRYIDEVTSGKLPRPYGFGAAELDFLPERWKVEETFVIGKLLALGLSNSLDRELLASVIRVVAPNLGNDFPLFKPAFDTFIQAVPTPPAGKSDGKRMASLDEGSHESSAAAADPAKAAWRTAALRAYLASVKYLDQLEPYKQRSFSNNWAIDGRYTDTGRPYMAGDPHQEVTSPITMVPFHMSASQYGGKLDVLGFTFPGTPILAFGQNRFLAWTSTVNFADALDVWDVQQTVDKEGHPIVRLGGKDKRLVARPETIRIRKEGTPVTYEDRVFEVQEVPGEGAIFPEDFLPVPKVFIADGTLFFRWAGSKATRESLSYLDQNRAATIDEFDQAIKKTQVGAVNIVFADKTTIAQRAAAEIPDRGSPSRGMPWRVVSGEDPENFWTRGFLADWQMPHERAPDRGYIVTANNDPFGFTADGSVDNDLYYYGAFYASSMRAHRAEQMLKEMQASGRKVTRADMESMQQDVHSVLADAMVPLLVEAVAQIGVDPKLDAYRDRPELVAATERLAAWNHNMDGTASEPIMFTALQAYATRRAFRDAITSTLFDTIQDAAPPFMAVFLHNLLTDRLPSPERFAPDGRSALLVAALADAVAWSQARYGTPWPDGKQWNQLNFAHWNNSYGGKFNAKDGVGGGFDTLRVSESAFFAGAEPATELSTHVQPIFQMVYGFEESGRPVLTLTIARGTSENPDGPHFADTNVNWLAGKHERAPFTMEEVLGEATEHLELK